MINKEVSPLHYFFLSHSSVNIVYRKYFLTFGLGPLLNVIDLGMLCRTIFTRQKCKIEFTVLWHSTCTKQRDLYN